MIPPARISCAVLVGALLIFSGNVRADVSVEQQQVAQLLAEGKLEYAGFRCREFLSDTSLSVLDRARLSSELLRVLTQVATLAPRETEQQAWNSIHNEAAKALRKIGADDGRLLVQFQQAVARQKQARRRFQFAGRMAVEATQSSTDSAGSAQMDVLKLARAATKATEEIQETIQALVVSRRRGRTEEQLDRRQLNVLASRSKWVGADARCVMAAAYPARSEDRVFSAGKAVQLLETLPPADFDPATWQQTRLLLMEAHRLAGNFRGSIKTMELFVAKQDANLPPGLQVQLMAEQIRVAIASEGWNALKSLIASAMDDRTTAGELDLAVIEGLLAMARAARERSKASLASEWEQRAADRIAERAKFHSSTWARRADALLGTVRRTSVDASSAEFLTQLADGLYRQGKSQEAAAQYRLAAEKAWAADDSAAAIRWEQTAASIDVERGEIPAAIAGLRAAALRATDQPAAATTHLSAIKFAAALLADSSPSDSVTPRKQYAELLEEHLSHWGGAAQTANVVRLWSGKWEQAQGNFRKAIAHYRRLPQISVQFESALPLMESCDSALLAQAVNNGGAGPATNESVQAMLDYYHQVASTPRLGAPVNQSAALAAVRLARYLTEHGAEFPPTDFPSADLDRQLELLNRLSNAVPPSTDSAARLRQTEIITTLIQIAISRGDWTLAARQWQPLDRGLDDTAAATERLCAIAKVLVKPSLDTRGPEQTQLRDEVLTRLQARQAQLSPSQTAVLARLRSANQTTSSDPAVVRAAFRSLLAEQPDDPKTMFEYAKWNGSQSDPESTRLAVDIWRKVATLAVPQSPVWFQAKLGLVRAHARRGDAEQALQLIRLTKAVHPQLGNPRLKREFAELERDLESRVPAAAQPLVP